MKNLLKGVCELSLIPMRAKPAYEAIQVSQLLFGEHYIVLKGYQGWFEIQTADMAKGWIPENQHMTISDECYESLAKYKGNVSTDVHAAVFFQKRNVNVLIGSVLPIENDLKFSFDEKVDFSGRSKPIKECMDFGYLHETAKKFRFAPYQPGGRSPYGIDEAGFVQMTYRICGYMLPRTLESLLEVGDTVNSKDISLGDVVILGSKKNKSAFIYMGEDQYMGVIEGQVQKIQGLSFDESKCQVKRYLKT